MIKGCERAAVLGLRNSADRTLSGASRRRGDLLDHDPCDRAGFLVIRLNGSKSRSWLMAIKAAGSTQKAATAASSRRTDGHAAHEARVDVLPLTQPAAVLVGRHPAFAAE
jgi:hypothetical protein